MISWKDVVDALIDYYGVTEYNSVIEIFLQQEFDLMMEDIAQALNKREDIK